MNIHEVSMINDSSDRMLSGQNHNVVCNNRPILFKKLVSTCQENGQLDPIRHETQSTKRKTKKTFFLKLHIDKMKVKLCLGHTRSHDIS
jgi:hypothetical protein